MISHSYNLVRQKFVDGYCSSLKKINSKIVDPLADSKKKVVENYKKIQQSIVGNYFITSVKENILECAGALGGAALGGWYLANTFETIGSNLGYLTGSVNVLGVAILTGGTVYQFVSHSKQTKITKLTESSIAGATAFLVSSAVFPQAGAQIGAVMGRYTGMMIGGQAGSILGGFIAIYINGSSEVLLDLNDLKQSYAIKTLQSTYACNFISYFIPYPIPSMIQDQIIGSLAFHSLTGIKPLLDSISEGTLLDKTLLKTPSITAEEEVLMKKGINNAYRNPSNRQKAFAVAVSHGVKKDLIQPFFKQDLEKVFEKLDALGIDLKSNYQQLIAVFMEAFNHYFLSILADSMVNSTHRNFTLAFIEWLSAKPEKQNSCWNHVIECENALSHSLQTKTNDYLSHSLLKDKQDQIPTTLDEKDLKLIVDRFLIRSEKLEEKLFAFTLTNDHLKQYVHHLAKIHLKCFNQFLALEYLKKPQKPTETLTRENYQLLNTLIAEYYSVAVESRFPTVLAFTSKKMIRSTKNLFDQQLQTAKLMDSTLSDFVDLRSLVSQPNSP
jgi:hypothetical protein